MASSVSCSTADADSDDDVAASDEQATNTDDDRDAATDEQAPNQTQQEAAVPASQEQAAAPMLYLAVLRRTGGQRHAPIAFEPKPQPQSEQEVKQQAGAPREQVASLGQW
jgi:hypothetical protein